MRAGALIAGVDEVGRGPLAGPVVAAAVILEPGRHIEGVTDSKLLTAETRTRLAEEIRCHALAYAIGRGSVAEIARYNIRGATLLAMARAVAALPVSPSEAWVDGRDCPDLNCAVRPVLGGDLAEPCIGAASILAKVTRDEEMVALDGEYPGYGFARHKGYSTPAHREALNRLGPCAIHRGGFAPVAALLGAEPAMDEE